MNRHSCLSVSTTTRATVVCRAIGLLIGLTITPASVLAADIVWGNAAGGRWADAANWVGGVVPGAADHAIINLPVTVQLDGNRTVGSFTVSNGTTLLIRGQAGSGNGIITVSGDSLNQGLIRLDNAGGNYYSRMTVAPGALLTNSPTGVIEFKSAVGYNRFLTGNIRNQGQIIADPEFDSAPYRISFTDGDYIADGGTITGAVYLWNRTITFLASPTTTSTLLLGGTCSVTSDVTSGYTLLVRGGPFGNAVCNVPNDIVNHGVIRFENSGGNYSSGMPVGPGALLTNSPTGVIEFKSAVGYNRFLTGNIRNQGQIIADPEFDSAPYRISFTDGDYIADGGTITGAVYLWNRTITFLASPTTTSTLLLGGTCSVTSDVTSGYTLLVRGGPFGNAVCNVPNDIVNHGVIRFENSGGNYSSGMPVGPGALLTNSPTGVIEFKSAVGYNRFLTGNIRNQGQIIADLEFDSAPYRISFTDGDYIADGGTITGAVYLRNRTISVLHSPPSESDILIAGPNCTLNGDSVPGYNLRVIGTAVFGTAICTVPTSLSNHAVIRLGSTVSGSNAQLVITSPAVLTNASDGVIVAEAGSNVNRYVTGTYINDGTVRLEPGTYLNTGAYTQSSSGVLEVDLAGTANSAFGHLVVSGHCSLDGTLRITRPGGYTPVLNNQFPFLTFGSIADWISCADIDGILISGNLRFSKIRNTNNLTLTVVDHSIIPGDPDCNCQVDLQDLSSVLANFGGQSGMTLADGDFDLDGDVDLSDLTFLLSNFGTTCN